MTMTITIGILYTLFGTLIRMIYKPRPEYYSPTVGRIAFYFLLIGLLNIGIWILSLQIQAIEDYSMIITSGTVVLFGIAVMLETFDSYKEIMNKLK